MEYTVYIIRVWSGKDHWEVERRYRDFCTLYRRLKTLFTGQGWIHPSTWSSVERESRKIFGNVSLDVVAERSALIQECLQSILHSRFWKHNTIFVQDATNILMTGKPRYWILYRHLGGANLNFVNTPVSCFVLHAIRMKLVSCQQEFCITGILLSIQFPNWLNHIWILFMTRSFDELEEEMLQGQKLQVQKGGEMILTQAVEEKNRSSKSNNGAGATKKNKINQTLKRVRNLSGMTEQMSKAMLDSVGIATGTVMAPVVQSQVGKAFLAMVLGQVLLASLDAVNKVLDTAEVAEKQALSATSAATTRMVSESFHHC